MNTAISYLLGIATGILLNILYVRSLRIRASDWPVNKEEPKVDGEKEPFHYTIFAKHPIRGNLDLSLCCKKGYYEDITYEDFPKPWLDDQHHMILKLGVDEVNPYKAIETLLSKVPQYYYGMGKLRPSEVSYALFAVYLDNTFVGYYKLSNV